MIQKLLLNFSGWVELDLEVVEFEYFGKEYNLPTINGREYLALSTKTRNDYIVRSLGDCINTAIDGETDELKVIVDIT